MSEFRRRLLVEKDNQVNEFIATYSILSSGTIQLLGDDFDISQIKEMYLNDVKITPTCKYYLIAGEHRIRCTMRKNFNSCQKMFCACIYLINVDFSKFNTKNVLRMQNMFQECRALKYIDLSSFDTQNVIYMGSMFNYCSLLTILDLSNFDINKVMTLNHVFTYCTTLNTLNISSWDIKNINSFSFLFYNCFNLIKLNPPYNWTQGDLDLSNSPIQPLSVHQLIDRAVSTINGGKQRTLYLSSKTLESWSGSDYFCWDSIVFPQKNIQIPNISIHYVQYLVIPEGITTIPNGICEGITTLISIVIPSTVTYIGDNAFRGCINVSTITMNPITAPILGENVWGDNESNYVGSNVSDDKYVNIKDEYIGYDTDKWNVLFDECGFTRYHVMKLLYLESYLDSSNSNGQYINTERLAKSTDVIKIRMSFGSDNNAKASFGWRRAGNNTTGEHCYINSHASYFIVGYGDNSMTAKQHTFVPNKVFDIEFNPNTNKVLVNGVEDVKSKNVALPYLNGNSVYPVYLFTANNMGTAFSGCNCRVYDYAVYDKDGNKVQHLVPVLDGNNRPCMYDTVSGKFHYNQRTNRTDDFRYA